MLQEWQHPATQAAIDRAAGFSLRPLSRVGILTNIFLGPEGQSRLYKFSETPSAPLLPSDVQKFEYDDVPIDAWHKDQVPMTKDNLRCVSRDY